MIKFKVGDKIRRTDGAIGIVEDITKNTGNETVIFFRDKDGDLQVTKEEYLENYDKEEVVFT